MERHSANTGTLWLWLWLWLWLAQHPGVESVYYPDLSDHP
ncbi:hypothetical protein KB20921_16130 [Edwardsiella ictaluri]|uniref:Uncharacterized protein n=1 Tax=Edwardsiella ictaluri (strain 93-146) TaxID=634503 RepID=C5BFJ0_EDWI9|nr:hypothetical protein NT01EI_1774 [Edwardsiella ictaluri 93-146]BEH98856.1 hypothetical protein KH20906_15840 [Edwardsiella ictaluri]BEI02352.1 hypothetical protein KB20921_16130 [Edwardsiella ictaluri]BEI05818.1 hypothetical protein KH201010_16040 [Edwardsiella ictaluri]BEI09274.1 hypothetical protein STU22726_16050 [Edwardsiella ictaluri]